MGAHPAHLSSARWSHPSRHAVYRSVHLPHQSLVVEWMPHSERLPLATPVPTCSGVSPRANRCQVRDPQVADWMGRSQNQRILESHQNPPRIYHPLNWSENRVRCSDRTPDFRQPFTTGTSICLLTLAPNKTRHFRNGFLMAIVDPLPEFFITRRDNRGQRDCGAASSPHFLLERRSYCPN
jgi:hypothetical protein